MRRRALSGLCFLNMTSERIQGDVGANRQSLELHWQLAQHCDGPQYRPTGSSKLKLAAVVQTYLALSPVLEQTSLYSGWVGKLLALAGDYWPAQYRCCCWQCCCCCHQPCLYLYFLTRCVTALAKMSNTMNARGNQDCCTQVHACSHELC